MRLILNWSTSPSNNTKTALCKTDHENWKPEHITEPVSRPVWTWWILTQPRHRNWHQLFLRHSPTGSLLRTPERWWTTQRDEHNRRWGTQTAHSPLTTGDWLTYKHRVWITVWLSSMSRLSNCLFQKQYATKSTGNTFIYNVQAGFPAKSSTTCSGCFWIQSCSPTTRREILQTQNGLITNLFSY